ncbi:MAG: hypothetical protein NVS2B16_35060 [Chloroflexota bacterium]
MADAAGNLDHSAKTAGAALTMGAEHPHAKMLKVSHQSSQRELPRADNLAFCTARPLAPFSLPSIM